MKVKVIKKSAASYLEKEIQKFLNEHTIDIISVTQSESSATDVTGKIRTSVTVVIIYR